MSRVLLLKAGPILWLVQCVFLVAPHLRVLRELPDISWPFKFTMSETEYLCFLLKYTSHHLAYLVI